MKLTNNLLESLTSEEVKTLTTEIRETVAFIKKEKKRTYSVGEYWDMQRRRRNLFSTRAYF